MKLAIVLALALLAANPCYAQAWTYIVVDSGGHEKTYDAPPWDLTYPPKGVSMQVIDEASGMPAQGTLLTPQQEQSRLDADKLIIANVPLPQSRGFRLR